MSSKDTPMKTIVVAGVLCIVCGVAVSLAAVSLKPTQELNKALDQKKNILMAAGLYQDGDDIAATFKAKVTPKLIELPSGEPSDRFDPLKFDQRKADKDPETSVQIPADKDIAGIKRRSRYVVIYEINEGGSLGQVVLPIHGKGLWSTMYGYLAVAADGNTLKGIGFYSHGETPGLGGEVDNPKWKALWNGKRLFDDSWNLSLQVIKGTVDGSRPDAIHQIDGLAGATITTRGVHNTMQYWLGSHGFGNLLAKLRQNGGV